MTTEQAPVTAVVTIAVTDQKPSWAVYILTKLFIKPTTE
jgi:hypothetical protein